jgi:hypothetical protein
MPHRIFQCQEFVALKTSLQSQSLLSLNVSCFLFPLDCQFVAFENLGRFPSETLRLLREKVAMKKMHICWWHEGFRDGHVNVSDELHCRRRTLTWTSGQNIENVLIVVQVTNKRVFRRCHRDAVR